MQGDRSEFPVRIVVEIRQPPFPCSTQYQILSIFSITDLT